MPPFTSLSIYNPSSRGGGVYFVILIFTLAWWIVFEIRQHGKTGGMGCCSKVYVPKHFVVLMENDWEIESSYRYRLEGLFQKFSAPPWSIWFSRKICKSWYHPRPRHVNNFRPHFRTIFLSSGEFSCVLWLALIIQLLPMVVCLLIGEGAGGFVSWTTQKHAYRWFLPHHNFLGDPVLVREFRPPERSRVEFCSSGVSEYGCVYGSKWWKSQYSVDSQLRTQLTMQPPQSSSKGNFIVRVRFGGVPSTVEEVVRVRFCCLLSWKTNTGNTGRTVLGHRPRTFAQAGIGSMPPPGFETTKLKRNGKGYQKKTSYLLEPRVF